MSKIIEAHGLKFEASGRGVVEGTEAFDTALHNIRQQLLSLSPEAAQALFVRALAADGKLPRTTGLNNLAYLAHMAAGLPEGQYITLTPLP